MSRRRLVAIVSAAALLALGLVGAAVVLSVTQTDLGREYVRRYLNAQVASRLKGRGTMYIGRMRGGLFTGVVVDSFAIRDEEDSLFVSTGPVHIEYDPRDILDKRLLIDRLVVERPFVNLRRHADGVWNYRRIFPRGAKTPRTAELRFGDYIVVDSATIRGGTMIVTQPWRPSGSLTRGQRDSLLAYKRTTGGHEIRETAEGLKRTWRWTRLEVESPYVRIADPDSAGKLIVLGRMSVREADPPFAFRNVSGPVRIGDDTVQFELPHFELPGSRGRARGMVHWKQPGPVRYDVQVIGDSVSLADVAWVYPTLPRTGGGRTRLHILTDSADPRIIDYKLTRMDVRSTGSHLRGDMTFSVGGPVLAVKDVALEAAPVDFDLFRALAGGPFPVDWQGQLTGTVRGRGGPLTRFVVDDANVTFRDAHVRGAVTRLSGRGGLNILEPALTRFHEFAVDVQTLDLRTPQFLFATFPRLKGTMSGHAVLDSSWLDVRFREADVTLRDGPESHASRFTGSGRVTYGELMRFEVDLHAEPIDFTHLARSYPMIEMRGPYTGPLRVSGTMADLSLATTLAGPAGMFGVDGHFDLVAPSYAARGAGAVRGLDVRTLFARPTLKATRLTGSYAMDVRGDSLPSLEGVFEAELDRSTIGGMRLYAARAQTRFADGRLKLDTLSVETSAATIGASGALGIRRGVRDSLRYIVRIDSLGGLRPWLHAPPSTRAARELASSDTTAGASQDSLVAVYRDSLAGAGTVTGVLVGSLDSLETRGTIEGTNLFFAAERARGLSGNFAFERLTGATRGQLTVSLDSATLGGVRFAEVRSRWDMADSVSGRASATLRSATGPLMMGALGYHLAGDTTYAVIDSVRVAVRDHSWSLVAPTRASMSSNGVFLDTLHLRAGDGAVSVQASLPKSGPVTGMLRATALPIADVGALAQSTQPLGGLLAIDLRLARTRADPVFRMVASAETLAVGDVRVPQLTLRANYEARMLDAAMQVMRDGRSLLSFEGVVPVNLSLDPVSERFPEGSLQGRISADSVDLALLEPMLPGLVQPLGRLTVGVDIGGSWRRITVAGAAGLTGGELGLSKLGTRLRDVTARVRFAGDSIQIDEVRASSGPVRGNELQLSGGIVLDAIPPDESESFGFIARRFANARYNVRINARDFEVIRQRRLADLDISGFLTFAGTRRGGSLEGRLGIQRGTVYLRDRVRKQVVNLEELEEGELGSLVDTSFAFSERGGFLRRATWVDEMLRNTATDVAIEIGDNVWLRSDEANIKLGGGVRAESRGERLTLVGTVAANRGTYRLNLGLVQRTFEVQRGVLDFYGGTVIDPRLDITAVHTVRQAGTGGRDIRIRVNIRGTLLSPKLELSSDERIPMSETQILSYLVTGAPTFAGENGGDRQAVAAAYRTLLPTLGSLVERRIAEELGSAVDIIQIQAGRPQDLSDINRIGFGDATTALQEAWRSTRIGVGKQLGERTFLTANAGVCTLPGFGSASQNQRLRDVIGITLEHRLNHGFSIQASSEPATQVSQCAQSNRIDFSTPKQLGIDLFREWSF